MEKGIGMMMKAMGLDPEKIIGDFESLKTTVTGTLKSIDETQTAIKNQQQRIEQKLDFIIEASFTAERVSEWKARTQQSAPAQQQPQQPAQSQPKALPAQQPAKQ